MIYPSTSTSIAVLLVLSERSIGGIGGETPIYRFRRVSDGFYLDFNDNTFKSSGWNAKSKNLTENPIHSGFYPDTLSAVNLSLPDGFVGTIEYEITGSEALVAADDVVIRDESPGASSGDVADAVWDEARSEHVASGSFGEFIDAAISSRLATTFFSGITSIANWLRALARKGNIDATTTTEINATTGAGTGTYDPVTDANEAIRDRGDAAWAGGGATAGQVADAVWDEAQADHVATGSFGKSIQQVANLGLGLHSISRTLFTYQTGAAIAVVSAEVRIFLKSDFDNGNVTRVFLKSSQVTDVNGNLASNFNLDEATYTILFEKPGVYGPNIQEITVTSSGYSIGVTIVATPVPDADQAPPIDVTTLARVKTKLGRDVNQTTDFDVEIDDMIKSISKRFEKFMGRGISLKSRQEYFDIDRGQSDFHVFASPVTQFEDVRMDHLNVFGTLTIINASNFTFLGKDGLLAMKFTPLIAGKRNLRVDYIGGMGTDTANFILNYPDISQAADIQVAFELRAKTDINISSVSDAGGTVTSRDFNLLPLVKETLKRYARKSIV